MTGKYCSRNTLSFLEHGAKKKKVMTRELVKFEKYFYWNVSFVHIYHFEKMYNNEILSLEVQIDARALVANKYTDQDILGQYKKYFYPHLKLK